MRPASPCSSTSRRTRCTWSGARSRLPAQTHRQGRSRSRERARTSTSCPFRGTTDATERNCGGSPGGGPVAGGAGSVPGRATCTRAASTPKRARPRAVKLLVTITPATAARARRSRSARRARTSVGRPVSSATGWCTSARMRRRPRCATTGSGRPPRASPSISTREPSPSPASTPARLAPAAASASGNVPSRLCTSTRQPRRRSPAAIRAS